jgi:hypothetical protein
MGANSVGTGSAGTAAPVPYSVQGTLTFDNGLPAAGLTTRIYNIGFAGQDLKLGETKSGLQGDYSISYTFPPTLGALPNVQVRVLDPASKEVTISNTKFNALPQETLNLVVPSSVQPLTPEFQRLSTDMAAHIGRVATLGNAQEGEARQDLTLLNQSTNWDARLVALAATAAQQTAATGLGLDVLYALYRYGLPTDPQHLAMVPSATVQAALTKASQAGIVSLTAAQINAAGTAFQNFATKTRLAMVAPGAVSSFGELLPPPSVAGASQFADLYFSNPSAGGDFWNQAAKLGVANLDGLRLQGKLLYLTFNHAALTQKLQQEIGTLANLAQLAEKDYHQPATWSAVLTAMAGGGGDAALQKLIPLFYEGTTADRLATYAGDLARKVARSFPEQVAAREIDKNNLAVNANSKASVSAFLRAAAPLGYELGRTPLHSFLKNSSRNLPPMDAAGTEALKVLERMYRVTPSFESLQAALKLGFTSARDIASYSKDEFMSKYANSFPSAVEAALVYGRAQMISAVTLNAVAIAKQLDSGVPVYALSGSNGDRQGAKASIVRQFPSMASLFGNTDFCQCEDCRSVLSPGAYFVDLLEFLRRKQAPTKALNAAGYTPLDVLIGKDTTVPGRRPDLGALPLTCENTNTAMPYIDLVNEIFEYYVANSHLDGGAAYDTGAAATADLSAEPQHILPKVYNDALRNAVYPLTLPFDLWIETVRGFLHYFKIPLSRLLEVFRTAETLELLSDASNQPYYRAQILAESLGLSPSEYEVLTVVDSATQNPSVQNWFKLYGYNDEPTALSELKSAKTLSQRLGLTYLELTDLVTTGFLNPALYPLIFQFRRFGIELSDAFSYTGQPGYPAMTAQAKATFEAQLTALQGRYTSQNPSSNFKAIPWLTNLLPANYSKRVLVLADPNSGCDSSGTILQYTDGSPATALDYLRFNLLTRLWKRLGWTLDELDRALQVFFPASLPPWSDPSFAAAFSLSWKTALVYLARLDELNTRLAPAEGRVALLPFWTGLPGQGENLLYARLFLTSAVLNSDWAFDDPNGQFPTPPSDLPAPLTALSAHQATIQAVLGLSADEITAILSDAGPAVTTVTILVNGNNATVPGFTLTNLSICYRYSELAKCLHLSVSDLIALKAISGLNPFQPLSGNPITVLADDILHNQTLRFVKEVAAVGNSGFTVEDLQYLLRQQFDPVGKYQTDPNVLLSLIQTLGSGLRQIQAQNAVPPDFTSISESLIDQTLSGLFPAAILKNLFTLITNAQTYTASVSNMLPADKIQPATFAQEPEISFNYDDVSQTQSVTYKGLLLASKRSQLVQINNSPMFGNLLDQIQVQAQQSLAQSIGDLLGVWASLAEYEAVQTGAASALPASTLMPLDSALRVSVDESAGLQWLGYRGVLTDAKMSALTSVPLSPPLASLLAMLLNQVQQQAKPAYLQLVGSILALWVNVQTYVATQPAASPIDSTRFSAALGNISGPVPEIQLHYDSGVQTLTCTGVLTDALRLQIASLPLATPVLVALLQDVRNQAIATLQFLATNLLTISPGAALDTYALPFIGIDAAKQQKQVKAQLVAVFQPLLAQKLSRQLVVQTLSANLGSDPDLTEALVSDAALLSDPGNPGESLLGAFFAVGQQCVSASYYTSTDGTSPASAGGLAATTDTADPTNNQPGTASAHFEGYLQVSPDGPYRFFAELGDTGAAAAFKLDSPDPAALFNNPIIDPMRKATAPGAEVSQFVPLKGGVAYHFTLDLSNLGAHGAALLIQGETLSKGPLSRIVLYPQQSVVNFARARTLLSKVLQIMQIFSLDAREIAYFAANAQFNNLRLSSLPTQPSDDSPANAVRLFSQFLTLADYADLRKGPAGRTDGLVDVFQAAAQTSPQEPNTPWTILAKLTRRDPQEVRDVATALGPDPHFTNNVGIRRIWDALQMVQVTGTPAASLSASTAIASLKPPISPAPDQIAASFKNAVQAQYTADRWRPIAQSVFDKLRQKKRDALVSYLLQALSLENSNQLFEYFLVDPGMEPVVQTSRLRLAMSSVQTFVQRCLLNLENANANPAVSVAPSAIDADAWEWMKRYRVWQANREIFLYPENWMEPELRPDKTDLFQALESELLQSDVTSDLVEGAFLNYLKGLDTRARLDIAAAYLGQDPADLDLATLYVLGRTYGHPHKYFWRMHSRDGWSAWQAVTPDIESDHIVLAVWKGRLCVFWVTFISMPEAPQATAANPNEPKVTSLSFGQLASSINAGKAKPKMQVQLHWSEYFQNKWSPRISSDFKKYEPVTVPEGFDPKSVYIHVSKDIDAEGNEGGVRIHLDFPDVIEYWTITVTPPIATMALTHGGLGGPFGGRVNVGGGHSFRVTSRNCNPDFSAQYWQADPFMPYSATAVDASAHSGANALDVNFESQITTDGSGTTETEHILQTVNNYELLTCANPVAPSPLLDPNEPFYWQAGGLVSPFFYKDTGHPSTSSELTFLVQPSLTEKTVGEWQGWAVAPPLSGQNWTNVAVLDEVVVSPQVPVAGPVAVSAADPAYSVYPMRAAADWATDPATAIAYGASWIGQKGAINVPDRSATGSPRGIVRNVLSSSAGRGLNLVGRRGIDLNRFPS